MKLLWKVLSKHKQNEETGARLHHNITITPKHPDDPPFEWKVWHVKPCTNESNDIGKLDIDCNIFVKLGKSGIRFGFGKLGTWKANGNICSSKQLCNVTSGSGANLAFLSEC